MGGSDDLAAKLEAGELEALLSCAEGELPLTLRAAALVAVQEANNPREAAKVKAERARAEAEARPAHDYAKLEPLAEALRDGKALPKGEGRTFSGKALVSAIAKREGCDRGLALLLARQLQAARLLHHETFSDTVLDKSGQGFYYRLHVDEPRPYGANVLNGGVKWTRPARPAAAVAEELRRSIVAMYDEALSEGGRKVDYAALRKSQAYRDYVHASAELQAVDLFALDAKERKAFFINVYNAMIVHIIAAKGEPGNLLVRLRMFSSTQYCIGGELYTPDEIENGVLRGNRPVATAVFGRRPFGSSDPRRLISCPPADPRIHFALVCGAKSCPPIRVYTPDNIDEALDAATAAHVDGEVEVDEARGIITLSKLLAWYAVDFGDKETDRLLWLAGFADEAKRTQLKQLVEGGKFKVKFATYNWDVNK